MAQIITHILPKTEKENKSNEKIYHKINYDNDMIYYIREGNVPPLEESIDMLQLLMLSDCVISRKTNKIVKYRKSIEVVIDGFLSTL